MPMPLASRRAMQSRLAVPIHTAGMHWHPCTGCVNMSKAVSGRAHSKLLVRAHSKLLVI